ncbi:MAG: class I SAM-dependent methyltransferase [Thermoleophilaceae bacterium]
MSDPRPPARDWDAKTYDRVSSPQFEWGRDVLDRLVLEGNEVVLDAGCGSGRVTALLLERLPAGRVVAVDASPSMVEKARDALGDERVDYVVSDLLDIELAEPVDAVLSTATFHWVLDQPRLFRRLHAVVRPGGQLVAQCGGEGNVERFLSEVEDVMAAEPYSEHFEDWARPWHFASPATTALALGDAGFTDVECWLEPREAVLDDPRDFVTTVCLSPHLDHLPRDLRDQFVEAVIERSGTPLTLDYVRLNMNARKPADA